MNLREARQEYHRQICEHIIRIRRDSSGNEYPNFADGTNRSSVQNAWGIVERIGCANSYQSTSPQSVGRGFEEITAAYLETAFGMLGHLRPGQWHYSAVQTAISDFDQYEHLEYLQDAIRRDRELATIMGGDYIVRPDIIIGRSPVADDEINRADVILYSDDNIATFSPLRSANSETPRPILHASISCKWTIRSDRSQNTRTEALNLIRNRKGHLPHIVAVTAEPLPTRIATLALGTGDLDCVYHFALHELSASLSATENIDQMDMLEMLIQGRRLRDISDLPFDLAA